MRRALDGDAADERLGPRSVALLLALATLTGWWCSFEGPLVWLAVEGYVKRICQELSLVGQASIARVVAE